MKNWFTSKIWSEDILHELYLTFGNGKSKLASKRIERFFSFSGAIFMILTFFTCKMLCLKCVDNIPAVDVSMLSGLLMTYGGWNTFEIRKDKNLEQKPTTENGGE